MKAILMTDRLGDLDREQLDHLAHGLEHAHEMTLEPAGLSGYWLAMVGHGGAILMTWDRVVAHVWQSAEAISAARDGRSSILP